MNKKWTKLEVEKKTYSLNPKEKIFSKTKAFLNKDWEELQNNKELLI